MNPRQEETSKAIVAGKQAISSTLGATKKFARVTKMWRPASTASEASDSLKIRERYRDPSNAKLQDLALRHYNLSRDLERSTSTEHGDVFKRPSELHKKAYEAHVEALRSQLPLAVEDVMPLIYEDDVSKTPTGAQILDGTVQAPEVVKKLLRRGGHFQVSKNRKLPVAIFGLGESPKDQAVPDDGLIRQVCRLQDELNELYSKKAGAMSDPASKDFKKSNIDAAKIRMTLALRIGLIGQLRENRKIHEFADAHIRAALQHRNNVYWHDYYAEDSTERKNIARKMSGLNKELREFNKGSRDVISDPENPGYAEAVKKNKQLHKDLFECAIGLAGEDSQRIGKSDSRVLSTKKLFDIANRHWIEVNRTR
ncbi:MAG: hypothetical protein WCX64_06240 [Candidatus Micrarchaeia archaeon]